MTPDSATTGIASLLTPPGRGALAVVGYVGPPARIDEHELFRARRKQPVFELPLNEPVIGSWFRGAVSCPSSIPQGDAVGEDVVLVRRAPLRLEVHCHGGPAAVQRILAGLTSIGARIVSWTDWIRATEGRYGSEWQTALSTATTWHNAGLILAQKTGPFGMNGLMARLRSWATARPALASEEDASRLRVVADLDESLGWSRLGLHLSHPWDVVVSGRPNVGKSSLVNALVGYARAIVSPQAGTTRDVVTAETALRGWAVRLSDTAGLRETLDDVEHTGIERARSRIAEADLNLRVIDPSIGPEAEAGICDRTDEPTDGQIVVAHKSDLPRHPAVVVPVGAIEVSSVTGQGLDRLADEMMNRLVPREPTPQAAIPFSAAQVGRLHLMREQVLQGDREAVVRSLADWTTPELERTGFPAGTISANLRGDFSQTGS